MDWLPQTASAWHWLGLRALAAALLLGAGLAYLAYTVWMPGVSHRGPQSPLSAEEQAVALHLRQHVDTLARTIGERNTAYYPALQQASGYIVQVFERLGYSVEHQSFALDGENYNNLSVTLPGSRLPQEVLVIGAHYDSATGTPGANDNGSGVAALLELARLLAGRPAARSIRLAALVNEEAPYFGGEFMGSRLYAEAARRRDEAIFGMWSLETLGYYSDAPGSQAYPLPLLRLFYPDQGNFLAFVGNTASRALVRRSVELFRQHAALPSEGIAAPNWLPGINLSDHQSFWGQGYPALMVTDTAPFRYPYYHSPEDTPDKLDYARTARAVLGLSQAAWHLADDTPP